MQESLLYEEMERRAVLSAAFPAWAGGDFTFGDTTSSAPYGIVNTFQLDSLPSATKTIYLDFDGHHSFRNDWNHNIQFDRYDIDGNTSSFSQTELIQIQRIFQNVAEDFLPFNVNVTTREPAESDLIRSGSSDTRFGIRVVMTQAKNGFGDNVGGKAKRNSFTDNRDTPVFGFAKGASGAAFIASHEVGHSLGLDHDGSPGVEYYRGGGTGETSWAPIMGSGYGRSLVQWSRGEYDGATNREDDIAIIASSQNGLSLRNDDRGDTFATAKTLWTSGSDVNDWGIITTRQDRDLFRFESAGGQVTLDVTPFEGSSNLDLIARLYDSAGNQIATSNPADQTDARISRTLPQGTYFLSVDGIGKSGSYTDYGSLGFFTIRGTVETPTATVDVGESGVLTDVTDQWQTVRLDRSYADPVVVAGPATNNGSDHATVRVRNVTSNSFQIRVDEWSYLDQTHSPERISFVVLESGEHRLADGTKIVAKNSFVNHDFRRIGFGSHFQSTPVVVSQVVTSEGGTPVVTRANSVSTGGFDIRLQEEERQDDSHSYERVGWIAIETGNSVSGAIDIEAGLTSGVNHNNHQIRFQSGFSSAPAFLASLQTYKGSDPANLRLRSINAGQTGVFVAEEKSQDNEVQHRYERVGYVALETGILRAVGHTTTTDGPDLPDQPVDVSPSRSARSGSTNLADEGPVQEPVSVTPASDVRDDFFDELDEEESTGWFSF